MKKYLLLHVGFKPPTPEIMEAWNKWFASLEDVGVDMGGFSGAKEINQDGIKDLPMDLVRRQQVSISLKRKIWLKQRRSPKNVRSSPASGFMK